MNVFNSELLHTVLEHGIFPDPESLSVIMNNGGLKKLKQISKFVPITPDPKLHELILNAATIRCLLDTVEWYAQQGFIPSIQTANKFLLESMKGHKHWYHNSYKMFEWLLQHNIYPTPEIINKLTLNPSNNDSIIRNKHLLTLLSEYGIYPTCIPKLPDS